MLDEAFDPFIEQLLALAPILVPLALVLIALAAPMPGPCPSTAAGQRQLAWV